MLLIQFLNALQFSMTLFLLAVGLTIIFGLMKIVNLAHGSLYMIGAYVGLSIWSYFDSFWLALIFSPIITSLVGAFLYLILFRHIQNADPMRQVLLTFGLIYIGLDSVSWAAGLFTESMSPSVSQAVEIPTITTIPIAITAHLKKYLIVLPVDILSL